VYGSLTTDSIRAVHEFLPEADGRFELPAGLSSGHHHEDDKT
jgi:hypothetical protein